MILTIVNKKMKMELAWILKMIEIIDLNHLHLKVVVYSLEPLNIYLSNYKYFKSKKIDI